MGLPLRFGVVHDFRCPPGSAVPMPRVYAETFEQIELVEQWGLDLCWFTEHHFIDDGYLPNFVPVAAAAAVTYGVRLLLWGGERSALQAVAEIAVFVAACALVTWLVERPLLREAAREARAPRLTAARAAAPAA